MEFRHHPSGCNSGPAFLPLDATAQGTIDWGDGTVVQVTAGDAVDGISHHYDEPGVYQVIADVTTQRYGTYTEFQGCLVSVEKMDLIGAGTTSLFGAFFFATQLVAIPDVVDTTNITDMSSMFETTVHFNQPFTFTDTSNVTSMHSMFLGSLFNQPLDLNTSSVTSMHSMFAGSAFNQPLSFNTSNVTNMHAMFYMAENFNQDLSAWDVSNVTDHENFDHSATAWQEEFKPTFTS